MAKRKTVGRPQKRTKPALTVGSRVTCSDNSGAREVEIIAIKGYRGRLNRMPWATVGTMCMVSVKKGSPKRRKQIYHGVVVRQKSPYRRPDGTWIQFEENGVVLTNEVGDPLGSEIRGPVAKEAAERWPRVAHRSSIIV